MGTSECMPHQVWVPLIPCTFIICHWSSISWSLYFLVKNVEVQFPDKEYDFEDHGLQLFMSCLEVHIDQWKRRYVFKCGGLFNVSFK